ncbi:hypothetical protein SKAU_G00006750 [Synaphobranchus kaupii]|uniref:Uncharacterized protein n=1 Tax=Synaphobranchus kaupii TaxID=118154 RepID=A0A9Q1G9D8_SYNKA|nr:hypothetical protein SKAU_G00006750 [Synaphobranchus kaupii]
MCLRGQEKGAALACVALGEGWSCSLRNLSGVPRPNLFRHRYSVGRPQRSDSSARPRQAAVTGVCERLPSGWPPAPPSPVSPSANEDKEGWEPGGPAAVGAFACQGLVCARAKVSKDTCPLPAGIEPPVTDAQSQLCDDSAVPTVRARKAFDRLRLGFRLYGLLAWAQQRHGNASRVVNFDLSALPGWRVDGVPSEVQRPGAKPGFREGKTGMLEQPGKLWLFQVSSALPVYCDNIFTLLYI